MIHVMLIHRLYRAVVDGEIGPKANLALGVEQLDLFRRFFLDHADDPQADLLEGCGLRNLASEALVIDLIGRQHWQPLLDRALAADPGRAAEQQQLLAQTTSTLITALHDRHVGITPDLAVGLARLLVLPGAQDQAAAPWRAVLDRLRRELRRNIPDDRATQRQNEQRDGFVLRDAPTYTIMRLALPLVGWACQLIGRSVLGCADDLADGVTPADYSSYAARLAGQIAELAE